MSFLPALVLAGAIAVPLALSAWPPKAPVLLGNISAYPRYFWPAPAESSVINPLLATAQIKRVAASAVMHDVLRL